MMFVLWNTIFILSVLYSQQLLSRILDADAYLNVPELVAKYGYTSEVHSVTTEDGYILEMHRISGSSKFPPKNGKKVAFLMHGLSAMSTQWATFGPDHAFAFQLADEGYDVWMGNSRGTDYSLNHTTFDPFGDKIHRKKYWSFSFHEIGVYDLPAMIDYILELTDQQKLQYVGHSQGTAVFFVMTAERPEYNEKIEMMHALAPAAFLSNIKVTVARGAAPFVHWLKEISEFAGLHYLGSSHTRKIMCRDVPSVKFFCALYLSTIMGRPTDQLMHSRISVIFASFADRVATKQITHFGQLIKSGEFQKYDHGKTDNLIHYNQTSPPKYNLDNVKAPIALYYAEGDWQCVVEDVQRLAKTLPNVVHDYLIPHKKFNHGDFAYGKDTPRLVYDEVLKLMKSSENV